jgi:hypothetical protein
MPESAADPTLAKEKITRTVQGRLLMVPEPTLNRSASFPIGCFPPALLFVSAIAD